MNRKKTIDAEREAAYRREKEAVFTVINHLVLAGEYETSVKVAENFRERCPAEYKETLERLIKTLAIWGFESKCTNMN